MLVLDTDILVDLYRRHPGTEQAIGALEAQQRLSITPITVQELVQGAVNAPDPKKATSAVEKLVQAFDILDFDAASAWIAGTVTGKLQKSGTPIGDLDSMIAACTMAHNGRLMTRNTKHFQRVPGLQIQPME